MHNIKVFSKYVMIEEDLKEIFLRCIRRLTCGKWWCLTDKVLKYFRFFYCVILAIKDPVMQLQPIWVFSSRVGFTQETAFCNTSWSKNMWKCVPSSVQCLRRTESQASLPVFSLYVLIISFIWFVWQQIWHILVRKEKWYIFCIHS